jgi:hypothetical protein
LRVAGILVGIALVSLLAWRARVPSPELQAPGGEAPSEAPAQTAASLDTPSRAEAPAGAALPDAQQIRAQLSRAKAQHALARAFERAAADGDFALAPGRIVKSLVDRRCGFDGPDSANMCRSLLFSVLKERLALPEDLSQDKLWDMLAQVDAAYERLVVGDPASARDEAFRAAYARFQEARRSIVGPDLDRRLFGLADEVLTLPFQVNELVHDSRASTGQKIAAYEATLQRIEREHGVSLASVVEPLELAKHALRLHETAGPLEPERRQAVLERYAGAEAAQRYLEHQREQEDRNERLRAFNQERDQLLEQLSREGLTPEQLRQRMAELDPPLFEKYRLR